MSALGGEFTPFANAAQAVASDLSAGYVPGGDVSAMQSAAAALQGDAQAVEADPAPSCMGGIREDLNEAARDYDEAAIDVDDGLDQYSAGGVEAAAGDIESGGSEVGDGTGEINRAVSGLRAFEASAEG
jgi:hypothetical protein